MSGWLSFLRNQISISIPDYVTLSANPNHVLQRQVIELQLPMHLPAIEFTKWMGLDAHCILM